eukprot:6250137-Alexandrium_andersonii.AAC.1
MPAALQLAVPAAEETCLQVPTVMTPQTESTDVPPPPPPFVTGQPPPPPAEPFPEPLATGTAPSSSTSSGLACREPQAYAGILPPP